MMWTLIVVAASGGITAATQSSLQSCSEAFIRANTADVKDAYCLSAADGMRVWIIKDGHRLTLQESLRAQ